jgi:Predicted EndoIII-related endonuclease
MPAQYSATDSNSGLEVTVTGEFPEETDDRVRIARTTNLFTRLMATILSTESTDERNQRFRAIETQLEIADSLIKGDMESVGELVRETLNDMGITEEQIREAEEQWREQIVNLGGDPD